VVSWIRDFFKEVGNNEDDVWCTVLSTKSESDAAAAYFQLQQCGFDVRAPSPVIGGWSIQWHSRPTDKARIAAAYIRTSAKPAGGTIDGRAFFASNEPKDVIKAYVERVDADLLATIAKACAAAGTDAFTVYVPKEKFDRLRLVARKNDIDVVLATEHGEEMYVKMCAQMRV
jgi:hypothetical protein